MADDKLKIVATVEDQFTGPLSKLQKGLKGVGDETAKQGAAWKKDWEGVRGEVSKFQGVLRGFDPILSAVGVGSFGAAMSIAGMVTAVKTFSGQTRDLSNMGRQIGMTVDQLRTLGSLGEKFGVSAESMRSAVGQFATNMVELRQRWGQVYGELKNMNLGKLAEDLVNAPNMEAAVETAMKALQNFPDSMKAARVSTLIFGTPDMATISRSITGKISDALKRTQAEIGTLDKETEQAARRFEEHFSRIGRAAENAKIKVLGPVLKNVAGALDQMDAAAADPEGEQIKRLKESRQSADNAAKAAPFGTGWYFERQRDSLDQEIARREKKRAAPATAAAEEKLGSAKAELDYYQNRRVVKDPAREKDLADEIRRLTEELRRLRENGQGGAPTVQQQSFGGNGALGGGSLIHKAAWGGFGASGGGSGIPSYGSPGGPGGGLGSGSGGGSGGTRDVPSGPDLGDGIRGRPFGSKGAIDGGGPAKTGEGARRNGRATIGGWWTPERQRHAIDTLIKGGVSDLGARALVARWSAVEARGGPGSVNPKSGAFGIAQWLGRDRLPGIKGNTDFDAQLAYALKELHGTERRSLAQLNRAKNPLEAATGASMFERAEGYNGRTGVDDFTGRTADAMGLLDGATVAGNDGKGPLSGPKGPLSQDEHGAGPEGAPEPTDGRGVNADLIKVLKRAQALSKVKFHIHEGLRTLERQREMVRRGWSKTMDSEHLKGRAVDVRADGDPAVGDLDRKKYEEINRAMRQASEEAGIPVEWGGDWKKFKDVPHFQFPKGYRAGPNAYAGDPPAGKTRADDSPAGKPTAPGGSKSGTLHIKVDGPPGIQVRHDMGDLFGDTTVSHGKSQMNMARA